MTRKKQYRGPLRLSSLLLSSQLRLADKQFSFGPNIWTSMTHFLTDHLSDAVEIKCAVTGSTTRSKGGNTSKVRPEHLSHPLQELLRVSEWKALTCLYVTQWRFRIGLSSSPFISRLESGSFVFRRLPAKLWSRPGSLFDRLDPRRWFHHPRAVRTFCPVKVR